MVPIFIFTLLNGAAVSVELEILSQVRRVGGALQAES